MDENLQEVATVTVDDGKIDKKNIIVYADKEVLASAIEEGIDKGLDDIFSHFKQQTKLFIFAILGIMAMLAVIALVLASYHNLPLH